MNKFKIGIVGAGKVGCVLGSAFLGARHEIVGVCARSNASKERAEVMLVDVPIMTCEEVVAKSEIVFFTLPDDVLEPFLLELSQKDCFRTGQIVVHCSGATTLSVFAPLAKFSVVPLSIHPVMTFTGTSLDLERLKNCVMAINGANMMLPIAQALVLELGAKSVVVSDAKRDLYHASLSHGANSLVTLICESLNLLQLAGIENPRKLLRPLCQAALDRAFEQGSNGISGPIIRGDLQVVARHLEAIEKATTEAQSALEIEKSYVQLSKQAARLSLENNNVSRETFEKVMAVLQQKS